MFTVGNLVTLFISIIVILVFRYLDKDNRSLEKIKRFTDKLMAEIDEYAAKREKDVKTYAAELDAYKMSAKEVLRQVTETQKNLEDKTNAMGLIAQRISEYDEALAELKAMSARVDENLQIIHNESSFVDKIANTLKSTKQDLEALKAAIPEIRAQAEQTVRIEAENYISEFRNLLDEYQQKASHELSTYMETLKETKALQTEQYETYKAQFDSAFEKAQKTARTLEHESFEQLKTFIVDRGKLLHDEFEKTTRELENQLTERTDKLEDALIQRSSKLEEMIDEKTGTIKEQLKDKLQDVQNSLKTIRTEWTKEAENLMNGLRSSVATMHNELLTAYTQANTRAKKSEEALIEKIQKLDAKSSEMLQTLQTKIKEQLKTYQEELIGKQQEYKDTIKKVLAELKLETEQAQGQLSDTEKSILTTINSLESKLNTQFEKRIETARTNLEQAFAVIEASKLDIKTMDRSLKEAMQAIQKQVLDEFSQFATSIREQKETFAHSVEDEIIKLQSTMTTLDEELSKLKAHAYENVSAQMKVFEDDFFADLKQRSSEIEKRLTEWRLTLEQRLETELTKSGEFRTAIEQKWLTEANERAKMIQNRIQEVFEKISANVEKYKAMLAQETQNTQEQIKNLHSSITKEIAAVKKDTEAQTSTIQGEIKSLSHSINLLEQDLKQRSTQALAEFSKTYETLTLDAGKRTEEIQSNLNSAINAYKLQAKEFEERFQTTIQKLNQELSIQATRHDTLFADFEKQFKNFEKETRLFERADELRQKLSVAIANMKEDLAAINNRQSEINELDQQYARIKKTEEEMNQKINRFLAEKRRLDAMEQDFNKLLSISQQIDQKLSQVTASNDQLTQIQVEIKKLIEIADEASSKYDRLEKKTAVIESTTDTVDKNFDAINKLEKTLVQLQEELNAIPNQIIDIKRSLSEIEELEPRLDSILEKYNTIDSVLEDSEKRIDNLQKAREWLVRAETRFEELNKKAGENLKLLRDVLKKEPVSGDSSSAPPLSVQDSVRKLAHQGWKTDEIAKALKLSRGEVELILELPYEK
ncbi:MAG TPA: hypothetical protein PK746_05485 [Spirochaetales bacterium]|nr:hypothetical protein [Spirochaetales bacterium]